MKKICVPGSLNVDLTLTLDRFHQPGETITARSINTYAGGKGGNQAVAAAKLGADVLMVGMLGDDDYGRFYQKTLADVGVDMRAVGVSPDVPSGMAFIEVDAKGENRIAIIPGTNALMSVEYVDSKLNDMLSCDICLMQFEIAIETVCHLAELLHARGKTVILDPAPVMPTPDALFLNVDYLTPNSTELALLTNMPVNTPEEVSAAAHALLNKGVGAVIAKLGEKGCLYVSADEEFAVPAFSVHAIDTTAAGDSFNAGFAVALADGMPIREALIFANAVGALSTTGAGAQGAMPTREQVTKFIATHGSKA